MSEIEVLIEQSMGWLRRHPRRSIEAAASVIRVQALLDAYKAIGGDPSRWRNEVGLVRR